MFQESENNKYDIFGYIIAVIIAAAGVYGYIATGKIFYCFEQTKCWFDYHSYSFVIFIFFIELFSYLIIGLIFAALLGLNELAICLISDDLIKLSFQHLEHFSIFQHLEQRWINFFSLRYITAKVAVDFGLYDKW